MKGLDLCRRYFEELGRPMLEREFPGEVFVMAAGLVGDGSDCFGFDDDLSRDHDWGPGFCLWLRAEDYRLYHRALRVALESLPDTFMGHGPRRTSQWGRGRVGVFEIDGFFRRFIGLPGAPERPDQWLVLPEAALAACTNGQVFYDPLGEFSRRRNMLSHYPEDVRLKKIAARCMSAGQAGQYNYPRSIRRGEMFAAQYAETKFCADLISLVFLINKRHMPFYKWMHRAVKGLPLLGPTMHAAVAALVREPDPRVKEASMERICLLVIECLKKENLTDGSSAFLPDHGPRVQQRIRDDDMRRRDVWIG